MATDKKQQKPTISPLTGLTPQQEQAAMWLLERVANTKIGDTNIRTVLKRQCTHDDMSLNWAKLSVSEYKAELARYGLSDD